MSQVDASLGGASAVGTPAMGNRRAIRADWRPLSAGCALEAEGGVVRSRGRFAPRLRRRFGVLVLALAVSGVIAPDVLAAPYVLTELGTLPGDNASAAYGVNNSGEVVGVSTGPSPALDPHSFVWSKATGMRGLVPGSDSTAREINDSGEVLGATYAAGGPGPGELFLWTKGGGIMPLGVKESNEGGGGLLSAAGDVAGTAADPFTDSTYGYFWSPAGGRVATGLIAADGLNNFGEVVGQGSAPPGACDYSGQAYIGLRRPAQSTSAPCRARVKACRWR
jgi:probable HAF family extracellular repeat protein